MLLREGLEIRCSQCGKFHRLTLKPNPLDTDFTAKMLFWSCNGSEFYAGTEGTECRHDVRLPDDATH